MTINIRLSGGLGNQMFQFAFGLFLKNKYNCQLNYEHDRMGNRTYMLHIFNIPEKKIDKIGCDSIIYNDSFSNDKFFPYDFLLDDKNYYIEGFFQNEKYFENIKKDIKNLFKVENDIIVPENYLVVQIRRTDYLSHNNHLVCDKTWYLKAINEFNELNEIIFVSDDLNWCKDNFQNLENKTTYFYDLNEKETLGFLQSSKNIIISNSSFGWWGAWLSNSNNVLQPKVWFKSNLTWDLGCENWKRL